MKTLLVLSCVLTLTSAVDVASGSAAVTANDVLAMLAKLPVEHADALGHYDRVNDAAEIAAGIAFASPSREDAADLAVYAAYESAMKISAVGDGGASRGPWQEKYVPDAVAFDPPAAARHWLWLAADARRRCAKNVPDERLAALASGSCDRGRAKVRKRAERARLIAQR